MDLGWDAIIGLIIGIPLVCYLAYRFGRGMSRVSRYVERHLGDDPSRPERK